jgi:hypothetical protein
MNRRQRNIGGKDLTTRPRYSVLAILLFIAPNALLAHAQINEDKPATASVTGRVTFDNQPLSGVTVALEAPMNLGSGALNTQRPPVTAKTDSNGFYRLTGIAAGYYLVWPRAMAYVMPSEGVSGRAGKTVNLSDGEQVEAVDFALAPGGVITGKITDHLGGPVIAQRVSLRRYTADNRTAPVLSPTSGQSMFETDDRGIYRLFGLQAGLYILSVGAEGVSRTNKAYARTFYPGVNDEKEAKTIKVIEGGETTDIDIKLPRPEKLYEAKGRVVDAGAGRPLAGVQISYSSLNDGPGGGATGMAAEPTDAQGEFVIQGLPAGKYAALMRTDSGSEYYSDPTQFEIHEGAVEGLEVKAYRCASISGVVVIEGASDPEILKHVTDVKIDVFPSQSQRLQTPFFGSSQMARSDGAFRLDGLRPGANRISASDTGRNLSLRLARVERDGADIRESIELAAGEQVVGLKVVMAYGSGVIRGQVAVSNGTLRPDLQLLVSAMRLNAVSGMSARPAQVDARGKFVIEGLAPGEYELRLFTVVRSGMPAPSMPPPVRQKIKVSPGENTVTLTLDFGEK